MGAKSTRLKHFKISPWLIRTAEWRVLKDKCCLDHIEFFQEDWVFLELLVILKQNKKNTEENLV